MDKKKTVLLFCPHLISKSGHVWQLLHIAKEKNTTLFEKEPVNTSVARKYFPRLPDIFRTLLNKFSEKQIAITRLEIKDAGTKMGHEENESDWFRDAFERKLHQDLAALRPYLLGLPCYHQTPSPKEEKRFITAPCSFSSYTPGLRFQVQKTGEGYYQVEPELELNGSFYPLQSFTRTGFLVEHKNEYFVLRYTDYRTLCWLQQLDWRQEGADPAIFSDHVLARLEKDYPVARNSLLNILMVETEPVGRLLLSEISGQFLMLTPQFDYDGFVVEGVYQDQIVFNKEGKEYTIARNRKAEQFIIGQVEKLHINFARQVNGYYYLSFDIAKKKNWFLKAFRQLLDLDIQVLGMDMLKHFRYCPEEPVTTLRVNQEEAGFIDISFSLHFGKEEIMFAELQKVILGGQQALPLKDGAIALLGEEWMVKYALLVKHAVIDKGRIRVPKWLAISLQQNEETGQALHSVLKKEWWLKWQHWQSSEEPLFALPATINASLRIYQQKGYEWLMLLNEIGAGMFLADDMGLGKTLQTICFMASLLESGPAKKILVVCPASLIYNWQNELAKFAPSISGHVYHGSVRDRNVFLDESVEIIISSYGILRSDAAVFLAHSFSAVILDESHTIKNPASQIAKLVYTLSADRRITLSGTPVMNNTFDLYGQLQFILPGMFGSQQFFKREYAEPIDRDRNEQRASDLQKMTAPFILRRTKEQVAKDLPAKTEAILWCQMGEAQERVYEEIRDRVKGELRTAIKVQGLQKSKLQVLQGILKLRQVCNSPALLKDDDYACTESIKTSELMEEIENNLSNHKALVFSQFTSMLDILSKELTRRNIPFLLLTGSTPARERDRMVEEFNSDGSTARVFLLSLKAGNAGLNLTAADYVFLFDPWWNSAVEQQAIDRTHRIGQTKNVFAYKLICKDSIEERIIRLQERKKDLAASLIGEEEGFAKALTEDDIEFLFR